VPLGLPALLRAIELNEVAVEANKAAFAWGRWAAHDPARLERVLSPQQVIELRPRETLDGLIARRVDFLTDYQNAAYAQTYRDAIERVRSAESALGRTTLTEAVARYLFKLMAYKDEYEVARLHTQTGFRESIAAQFEGDYRIHHHLAPPGLSPRHDRGELQKRRFGSAMGLGLRLLAHLRVLRGTAVDVFGYTDERRGERALVVEYQRCIHELLAGLDGNNHTLAVDIARLPEAIRGFGHVKARHLAAARIRWAELMARWRGQVSAERRAA